MGNLNLCDRISDIESCFVYYEWKEKKMIKNYLPKVRNRIKQIDRMRDLDNNKPSLKKLTLNEANKLHDVFMSIEENDSFEPKVALTLKLCSCKKTKKFSQFFSLRAFG